MCTTNDSHNNFKCQNSQIYEIKCFYIPVYTNKITRIYRRLSEVTQQFITNRGTLRLTKHTEVHIMKDREGGKLNSP